MHKCGSQCSRIQKSGQNAGAESQKRMFCKQYEKVLGIEKKNIVKEFARKVKNCSYCDNDFMDGKWHRYVFVDDIDKLLKEYEDEDRRQKDASKTT